MDVKEADILGEEAGEHWYYVAKGLAVRRLLGDERVGTVLDVGAGSGVFSRQLLAAGVAEAATCVDVGYDAPRDETYHEKPIRFVREVESVTHDLILMMDVLEHVDDDVALLRRYSDAMSDTTRVLITVPAFQALWSGHDVFLGHRRRYTLAQVEELVRRCGLRVQESGYFFGPILPVVAAVRLWHRLIGTEPKSTLEPAPSWLNEALVAIHRVESRVLLPRNRLGGLSVMCLAGRR
jgi:hypothetical protein